MTSPGNPFALLKILAVAVLLALVTAAPAGAQTTAAPRVRLTLTGDPATPAFISARIAAALGALAPAPGSVRVEAILPAPEPLERGFLTSFSVPISIDPGTGAAASRVTATVDVVNARVSPFAPAQLAFTDDPERIVADGVLSRTTVAAGRPARLYYYHENVGVRRRFCVVLAANGSVRTRVQIVGAAAGPNVDVMSVGHAVSKAFVTLQPTGQGTIRAIAGGRPILERDTLAGPGDVVAGALDLRVLYGGPVTVTVLAIPPAAQPAAFLYGPKLPDDGHDRHGIFALRGFGRRIVAYTAGGPAAVDEFGSRADAPPAVDPSTAGHDYGDYGALEHVTFDVDNPAAAAATVYLFERPLGGAVRSSFSVNGSLVEVGCVRVARRYLIAPYVVAAHGSGTLDVLTMTDGGSNYPLEIGVTTTPPIALPPPIAAPDGCFPKPAGRPPAAQPVIRPAGL